MTEFRKLQSNQKLKSVMQEYYSELEEASLTNRHKIAWCSSQGPVELLRALGFLVYFPENHGALLGAKRKAEEFIAKASSSGYSPDICSYLTSDIGAFLSGETPLQETYNMSGLPVPDVLVYNNNQCRDVQEWFEFYARRYEVPIFGIRTPRGVGDVSDHIVRDVANQMESVATELALMIGQKFNLDDFCETLDKSIQTTNLWKQILEMAKNRPSPISFFDTCIHIGPAVALRGTKRAVTYYKSLLDELEYRVDHSIGAVPEELYRIYWEGMPIWGKIRFFASAMAKMKASVMASTYAHSWVFDAFDSDDPFISTAKAYTVLFTVRSERYKESFLTKMFKKFQVDGVIYHNSKTCPNCSNCHYGMPQRIGDNMDIPYLIIDGDLNDLRFFSQEQTLTNIEAFVEMLSQEEQT